MRHSPAPFAALAALLLGLSFSLPTAADDEIPLRNWAAPPYWSSAASTSETATPVDKGRHMGREVLALPSAALPFIAISPCRVADTRDATFPPGFGIPMLNGGGAARPFVIPSGPCPGIPTTAAAFSLNFTVVAPSGTPAGGYLSAWPTGSPQPVVSTLNFTSNSILANAAIVPAGTGGSINLFVNFSTDLIIDINGYYAGTGVVTTLNTLKGDVTLAQGSNVTITPSGQTLTLSAAGTSSNTPSTLVARDSFGNFSAGTITGNLTGAASLDVLKAGDSMAGDLALNPGNLNLVTEPSTATSGNILKGGSRFIHDYGTDNMFVGLGAGNFTMTGFANTATGYHAFSSNSSGTWNTAIGTVALAANDTGNRNTALGEAALPLNSSGSSNTAAGNAALSFNSTGSQNTAIGVIALGANSTGDNNTASGYLALGSSHGSYNTAAGYSAGARSSTGTGYNGGAITFVPISTGSYNSFLGAETGATADVSNCTAVGMDAYCDATNQVRLGNFFVASIGGKVAWSALSDRRAKKDVRDLSLGLDFVKALRPVEYRFKSGNERVDMGFVAQDVEEVLGEGYNVVDVGGDAERTLSLRYTELIAPLVKAVQEQQREIEALRQERSAFAESLRQLEERLAQAEAKQQEAR